MDQIPSNTLFTKLWPVYSVSMLEHDIEKHPTKFGK